MATVERPNSSLRILLARAAVFVIAGATLLALTGARPADAPAGAPLDQLAQAPVDQPFEFPDTTDDAEDEADTLDVVPPSAQEQAPPPASPAVEDTTGAFRPDLNAVPQGAAADSNAVPPGAAPTSASPDTLFMPSGVLPTNPQPPTTPTTQPHAAPAMPGPKQEAPKPRKGLLGVHPIAILVGLAALHVMVTHLAE